jgi:hypothetical protein
MNWRRQLSDWPMPDGVTGFAPQHLHVGWSWSVRVFGAILRGVLFLAHRNNIIRRFCFMWYGPSAATRRRRCNGTQCQADRVRTVIEHGAACRIDNHTDSSANQGIAKNRSADSFAGGLWIDRETFSFVTRLCDRNCQPFVSLHLQDAGRYASQRLRRRSIRGLRLGRFERRLRNNAHLRTRRNGIELDLFGRAARNSSASGHECGQRYKSHSQHSVFPLSPSARKSYQRNRKPQVLDRKRAVCNSFLVTGRNSHRKTG